MNNYKFILALDPSGNYTEGKGTTGWCVFNVSDNKVSKAGSICARSYSRMEDYWDAHIRLLDEHLIKYGADRLIIVIEDYLLYASKAKDQINSKMETPKLIGLLQWWCYKNKLEYKMQPASMVKDRWKNDILNYKGYIKKDGKGYTIPGVKLKDNTTEHTLDAVRHAVHYYTFNLARSQLNVV